MWNAIAVFVVVFGAAVLLLGLTNLDAVEGGAVAFFVAVVAAFFAVWWKRGS